MTRSRELRWTLPALALVVVLAAMVRVTPAREVVFGDPPPPAGEEVAAAQSGVRLLGVDSYFHLRHARHVAKNFPSLMRFDPWTGYAVGTRVREVGLYDLATGGVAWALGRGDPDERLLQTVLAWTPVAVATAAFLALFAAAAALWGPVAGLVAAILLLTYPGTFLDRSLLGYSDYHVVEVLFVLLLLLAVTRLLPGTPSGPKRPREAAIRGAVAALPLIVFHITWVGAPLWLVLLGPALLVGAAGSVAQGDGRTVAAGIAVFGLTFTVGLVGLLTAFPVLVQEPTVIRRVVLTGAGVALLLPAGALLADLAVDRGRASPGLAGGLLLLVGVAAIDGVILLTPPGRELWVTLTGMRTELVAEHVLDWQQGLTQTVSLPGLLAVFAPVLLLIRAWRVGRWTELAPVTLAILGIAVALRTGDFDYLLAPSAAFLAAATAAETRKLIEGRSGWIRWAPAGAFFLLIGAPVVGAVGPTRPWATRGEVEQLTHLEDPMVRAMQWMGSSTPAPASPFSYGVLTAWDHGNVVAGLAERPVLWSQGPSARTAGLLLAAPGDELEGLLAATGGPLRYVLVDDRTLGPWARAKVVSTGDPERFIAEWGEVTVRGHRGMLMTFGQAFEGSLAYRIFYGDGDGLGHYRLVFQSREESLTGYIALPTQGGFEIRRDRRRLETEAQRDQARAWAADPGQVLDLGESGLLYGVRVEPAVQIYERVEGALLMGQGPPGRRVHVAIMIEPGRDGGGHDPFLWESGVAVDQDGRWEVRVPYVTHPTPSEGRVAATSAYRVFLLPETSPASGQVSSRDAELLADGIQISEEQIQEGAIVRIPGNSAVSGS